MISFARLPHGVDCWRVSSPPHRLLPCVFVFLSSQLLKLGTSMLPSFYETLTAMIPVFAVLSLSLCLRLARALQAMNISVTTLKRLCRRHGVKRWPHRQISGINRAMAHLEFQQDQAGRRNSDKTNARNNQVSEQMQELLRRRKVMIEVSCLFLQACTVCRDAQHTFL